MSGKLKLKSNLSKIDSKKSVKCLLKFKSKAFLKELDKDRIFSLSEVI